MITNIATLKIDNVIVHDVPKHLKRGIESHPDLSEIESPLSDELRLFFSERIKEIVSGPAAFRVIADPASGKSPVPEAIMNLLLNKSDLVTQSQIMARHLHSIQTGVNPGGLLTVIESKIWKIGKVIAILKLERQEGVRVRQDLISGKHTFQLGHIKNLMLTEKTRVFKMGLFCLDNDKQLIGVVCDQQRGYVPQREVASFFLTEFLGCSLVEDPAVLTKRFFETTSEFINRHIGDPVKQQKYYAHLMSDITSNRQSLAPRHFSRDYLDTEDQQEYLDFLGEREMPLGRFPKELGLISSHIRTTVMAFASGIQIRGPQEALDDHTKLTGVEGRSVEVIVKDVLTEIKSK